MIGGNNILWHKGEVTNLFVGVNAGLNTAGATAFQNTYIGNNAGAANTTGQRNTAVGANAGQSIATANFNTFIGTEAGRSLLAGNHNTFVGEQAGDNQVTGTDNSIFGAHTGAGGGSGVGNRNTMLGAFAGAAITNGDDNTFVGRSAGSSCSDGTLNTFTGFTSGAQCNLGFRNTMNGAGSGVFTSTGSDNVFMGFQAGRFNRTGSNNTYIGTNSGTPVFGFITAWNTATNATALGNGAIIRRSNVMILGNNLVNVGIGLSNDISTAQGPQNKLEIDAGVAGFNPSPSGASGTSGLRLRDLHSGNTTITNPGTGVLSVDASGDVIYVPDQGGNFGVDCGSSNSGLLPNDWRIGMNGHSVNFEGIGNVNIGDLNTCVPGSTSAARLWIRNTFFGINPVIGLQVDNGGMGPTAAAAIFNGNVQINGIPTSVQPNFNVSDKTIKKNITTITKSLEIISRIKASSFVLDNTSVPQLNIDSIKTYGFIAQNIETVLPELVKNVLIHESYDGAGNVVNPAVTLKSLNYTGILPFAIAGIQELNAKQNEMQTAISGLSDVQVKTNINSFNALATVKTLSPVKYNFTNANVPQLNFKSNTDYGFIAQQLETVYPELVDTIRVNATYDSLGTVVNPSQVLKTVNYKAISALLVRSVQEQQQTIDSLRSTQNAILQQLSALASQINSCCSNTNTARQSNSTINQMDIELSDKDVIVLNQNVPNPFAEQTTITYNVPASVGKAQLIFFNTNGQVIQTVDIKTRGKGKVNVFASDLSSGLYNYTLVADGKVIDSKKMVRE